MLDAVAIRRAVKFINFRVRKMKLLQKLRESLAKALKDQEAIIAKLVNAEGETRSMSEEENSQYEALSSSIKDIKAQIERAKSLQEEQAEIEKTRSEAEKTKALIEKLKNAGAQGILIIPIEKMIV